MKFKYVENDPMDQVPRGSSFLGSPKAQVLTAAGLTLAVQGIYVAQSLSPLEHLTPCLAAVGLTGASAWFFRPLLQPRFWYLV